MRVKFIGEGTYTGEFDGKERAFGPGWVLEVSEDTGKALLERQEGGKAVWEATDAPAGPAVDLRPVEDVSSASAAKGSVKAARTAPPAPNDQAQPGKPA